MTEAPSSNLDLLRTIAVLLVLGQHLFFKLPFETLHWLASRTPGVFGVFLFFVHTSLVLMLSMQRSSLEGAPLVKSFYTRRVFRIYPLALITVLIVWLLRLDSDVNGVQGLTYHPVALSARGTLAHVFLIQNLLGVKSNPDVLWSLPFELQMYVVLPFLFLWIRGKPMIWPLLGLWCASVAAGWMQPRVHQLVESHGINLLSILPYVPYFLPGVMAFTLLPRRPVLRSWLWPVFILLLLLVYLAFPNDSLGWVLCLALGLMLPMFQEIKSVWARRVSLQVATYSYGIYLTHSLCLWFAFEVLRSQPAWIKAPVLIASLVLLPVLAYHWVERPLIQVGQGLASRWTRAKVGAPA